MVGGTKQAAAEEHLNIDQLPCLEEQIQGCFPPSLCILQRRLRWEELFLWSLLQEKGLAISYYYLSEHSWFWGNAGQKKLLNWHCTFRNCYQRGHRSRSPSHDCLLKVESLYHSGIFSITSFQHILKVWVIGLWEELVLPGHDNQGSDKIRYCLVLLFVHRSQRLTLHLFHKYECLHATK